MIEGVNVRWDEVSLDVIKADGCREITIFVRFYDKIVN